MIHRRVFRVLLPDFMALRPVKQNTVGMIRRNVNQKEKQQDQHFIWSLCESEK